MCEQTGYRVKRVEKKKNRKRAKNRPKPGKSFEREDLENAFEITIKAHRIRFVNLNNILLYGKQGTFFTFFNLHDMGVSFDRDRSVCADRLFGTWIPGRDSLP